MSAEGPHTLRKIAALAGELNGVKLPAKKPELLNDPVALRAALKAQIQKRTVKVSQARLP